ncbi:MAG: hypothetical protein U9P90_01075 [Patescibacteria group bacterium]|nr:hypothetical protein [Patescibacteria group bacterium]
MPEYKKINLYKGDVTILFDDSLDKNGKPRHAYWRHDPDNLKKDGTPKMLRIAGVTSIIKIDKSQYLIPWAVEETINYLRNNLNRINDNAKQLLEDAKAESERQKREAGDIGKAIHEWIENHAKGLTPDMPTEENIKRGVISFMEWEEQNKVGYLESEKIVYSKKYDYVGTLDMVAKVNGKLYLLDLKTGNRIYPDHFMQTAAYLKADTEERTIKYDGRIILRVSKETEEEHIKRLTDKGQEKYINYKAFEAIEIDKDGPFVHRDFEAFLGQLKTHNWLKEASKQLK